MGKTVLAIERFLLRVEKTDSCWNWTKFLNHDGYGIFCLAKKKFVSAHRFSYQYHKGEIIDGYEIDHLCSNRKCVNPEHLEAVTHRENVRRGAERGGYKNNANFLAQRQKNKTHCKNGHEYSGSNLIVDKWHGGRRCRICEQAKFKRYADKIRDKNE